MNIFVKEEKRFNPFSLNSMAHFHILWYNQPMNKVYASYGQAY